MERGLKTTLQNDDVIRLKYPCPNVGFENH
jgi:hypothetical protein